MKRLITLMIMLAFIAVVPSTVFANGAVYKNVSQWCTANDDLNMNNHGSCVKFMKACEEQGNNGPVCSCKELQDSNPTGFYEEYNNLGECISHLRLGYIPD